MQNGLFRPLNERVLDFRFHRMHLVSRPSPLAVNFRMNYGRRQNELLAKQL